jgi:hypothetical protein
MTNSKEDSIRKKRAEGVVAPTRKYFSPYQGKTVEAADLTEAKSLVNEEKKDEEVGDDQS